MDLKGKSIKKYPVGSLGFELLHSTTLEYKIECLDDYTTEIRNETIDECKNQATKEFLTFPKNQLNPIVKASHDTAVRIAKDIESLKADK